MFHNNSYNKTWCLCLIHSLFQKKYDVDVEEKIKINIMLIHSSVFWKIKYTFIHKISFLSDMYKPNKELKHILTF
jgi:hypothetical protein